MDQNSISQRACTVWESKGQPDSSHEEHWQPACRVIEAGEAMAEQCHCLDITPKQMTVAVLPQQKFHDYSMSIEQ